MLSLISSDVSTNLAIFANHKEGNCILSSLQKHFFRLSGWGTPNRRAPGRIECTNPRPKPLKRAPKPSMGVGTDTSPDLGAPDELGSDNTLLRKRK